MQVHSCEPNKPTSVDDVVWEPVVGVDGDQKVVGVQLDVMLLLLALAEDLKPEDWTVRQGVETEARCGNRGKV